MLCSTCNPTSKGGLRSLLMGLFSLYFFMATRFVQGVFKPQLVFIRMLAICKYYQIFNSIIRNVSINMMNMFRFIKKATKMLFHNQTVLRYIPLSIAVGMVRSKNKSVPGSISYATSVAMAFRSLLRCAYFGIAFGGSSNAWSRAKLSPTSLFIKGEQFSTSRAVHDNEYISCALEWR
jgi:hypothetical protein